MKVLLINPPIDNIIETEVPLLVKQNEGVFPPLGLLYISSYLSKNANCKIEILDSLAKKMSYKEIEQFIWDYRPDIVGITAHTHNLLDVIQVANSVKRVDGGICVCLGGPHVAAFPQEAISISSVDFVVPGEGEVAFAELVKGIEQNNDLTEVRGILFKQADKIIQTGKREGIKELDSLPFPDRLKLDYKKYYSILGRRNIMTTMVSSRGCPYQCIFCSTPKGSYLKRSPENVVDEIEGCLNLGIKEVHFVDDTFNIDPERVVKICEEIIKRKLKIKWSFRGRVDKITKPLLTSLKKAGCYRIHLGVETSSEEGLERLKKGLSVEQIKQAFKRTRDIGINTVAYFLIGCPHEKMKEEVVRTINFSKEIDPDFALFNILTPYPATELYEEGLNKGILKRDCWKEFALNPKKDFRPPFWEEWLSPNELVSLLNLAYRRFYIRPRFMLRAVCVPQHLNILARRLKTGLEVFKLPLKR
jgi:anaerobic magnesium-protoporphyrin IX monomethyl ester cyclase